MKVMSEITELDLLDLKEPEYDYQGKRQTIPTF